MYILYKIENIFKIKIHNRKSIYHTKLGFLIQLFLRKNAFRPKIIKLFDFASNFQYTIKCITPHIYLNWKK